jgi:ribose 5-phosphate isomerase B
MPTGKYKIVFGSDHGGFDLKKNLIDYCVAQGFFVADAGCESRESVDYPDAVNDAVALFRSQSADFLVLVCGSGVGVSIAANRHPDIRAIVTDNPYLAGLSRRHNHANCLCLGERLTGVDLAVAVLDEFLKTECDNSPRHCRRVKKLGSAK